jgi:hypothetical protein
MNWKAFFKGFAAAVFGGAAASVTQIVTTQGTVQPKQIAIGAGIGGAGYRARLFDEIPACGRCYDSEGIINPTGTCRR